MDNFAITYKLSDDWQDTTVKIAPLAITVDIQQIVPDNLVYNGQEQELKQFKATVAEDSLNKLKELGLESDYVAQEQVQLKEGKGVLKKDAGTYSITFLEEDFKNSNPNYDVTFNVPTPAEDVVIQKKKITVVAASADKEYNFEPLTNDWYAVLDGHHSVAPEGTEYEEGPIAIRDVAGEFIYAEVESDPQVTPGSTTNFVKNWWVEGGDEDNYDIVTLNGTLTIKNREDPYEIVLKVNSDEYTYDGQEHTVEGLESATLDLGNGQFPGRVDAENNKVTFTVGAGTTYTVELTHPEISRTETDAGAYKCPADEKEEETINQDSTVSLNGQDVKDNFTIEVIPGTLTIAKRPIVLVAASAEQEFDGGELTNAGYAVLDKETATDEDIATLTYTTEPITLIDGTELTATVEGGVRFVAEEPDNIEPNNIITSVIVDHVTYTPDELDRVPNFAITLRNGTLEITKRTEPFAINLTGKSDTITYDGQEHSLQGFAEAALEEDIVGTIDGGNVAEVDKANGTVAFDYQTASGENVTFYLSFEGVELKETDANEDLDVPYILENVEALVKAMRVIMRVDGEEEDVSTQFSIALESGELFIQPRPVNVQVTGKKDFGLADPEFDEYGLQVEFLSLEGEGIRLGGGR